MNDGVIDVYAFPLDVEDTFGLDEILSPDERERAARFRFPRDRRRYVVGRAQMRAILARRLNQDPRRLEFVYGSHGKPALPGQSIGFNMTRSHALGLLAIQPNAEVGIDVELLRPFPEALDIAQRFFAADEYRRLASLPGSAVDAVFFECWTRKEAVVKSAGLGLSQPLDAPPDRWVTQLSELAPAYVAAVASTVPPRSIHYRSWPP